MIESIAAGSDVGTLSPDRLVDSCLDEMGIISVSGETRALLENYASQSGEIQIGDELDEQTQGRVAQLLQMVAASHEFQRA